MDARAGGLACGVESFQIGPPAEVRRHAAHGVVRRRTHGRRLQIEIDAVREAGSVNPREAMAHETLTPVRKMMRKIEVDVLRALAAHLVDDCPGDNVARRQFLQRMVALHKALALGVQQKRAFTAQRFGKQETRRTFDVQRRRMELNELQVADVSARAIGQRHAVARGYIRVRGVAEDTAHPAGRQQYGASAYLHQTPALLVRRERAAYPVVLDKQVQHARKAMELHRRKIGRLHVERARNLASRGIAVGVQDAAAAVGALASKQQVISVAVEVRAPLDQAAHLDGAFLYQDMHRFAPA